MLLAHIGNPAPKLIEAPPGAGCIVIRPMAAPRVMICQLATGRAAAITQGAGKVTLRADFRVH